MASTMREMTSAVSRMVSWSSPTWSVLNSRNSAWPPSFVMAVSNETRVRVEGWSNIMPSTLSLSRGTCTPW